MNSHVGYTYWPGRGGGGVWIISFILICLMLSFLLMQMVIYLLYYFHPYP